MPQDLSRHISALLVESCRCNQDSLTRNLFQIVTHDQYLPYIHPEAALTLLDLERQFDSQQEEQEQNSQQHLVNKEKAATLSSIQKRCIEAMTLSTTKTNSLDHDDLTILLLSKQNPWVLANLFTHYCFVQNIAKEKLIRERDEAVSGFLRCLLRERNMHRRHVEEREERCVSSTCWLDRI